jgi:D-amino peptidase
MVAGDLGLVKQAQELFPGAECVAVKEGIGKAAKMLHPAKSQEMIKKKTKEALTNLKKVKPLKLKTPITMEIRYKAENDAGSPTKEREELPNYDLS